MFRAVDILQAQGGHPMVVVEFQTSARKAERVTVDVALAIRINAQFFGIIREAWSRFHEMLISEAQRNDREHKVRSERRLQLEVSYNEGLRIAQALRQASHIRVSEPSFQSFLGPI